MAFGQDSNSLIDYEEQFQYPAEADFFTADQNKQLEVIKVKMGVTHDFVASIVNKEDFDSRVEQAVVDGKIYSPSLYNQYNNIFKLLDNNYGLIVDITESLVSPSGQRVIMSRRLQNILGLSSDATMETSESDKLTSALAADGVAGPDIDKVNAAMNKYGMVIMQRGVFMSLKKMLEEAVGHQIPMYIAREGSQSSTPETAKPTQEVITGEDMPAGFIEYMKNHDKDYDRLEHDVMLDPNFVTFFDSLKQHYDYYKTMPSDRMAQEIILRPPLWNKLQPATQAAVQELVEKHRAHFLNIVKQVATVSGFGKLEELKKNLGK